MPSLAALYLDLQPGAVHGRPWVAMQMVRSVDGAIALDGRSAGLGGSADRQSFRRLRARADVVLVGAGTARVEGYRPPRCPDERAAGARRARGQSARPRLAIATRSGDLAPEAPWWDDDPAPIVLAPAAADLAGLGARADVRVHGTADLDLAAALRHLADDGVGWVTLEGGPAMNASMLAAGLVDEVFVTSAPLLVGRPDGGMVATALAAPVNLRLGAVAQVGDELLLRYRVLR